MKNLVLAVVALGAVAFLASDAQAGNCVVRGNHNFHHHRANRIVFVNVPQFTLAYAQPVFVPQVPVQYNLPVQAPVVQAPVYQSHPVQVQAPVYNQSFLAAPHCNVGVGVPLYGVGVNFRFAGHGCSNGRVLLR